MDKIWAINFLRDGGLWGNLQEIMHPYEGKSYWPAEERESLRPEDIISVCMWTHGILAIIRYVYDIQMEEILAKFIKGWQLVRQSSGNHASLWRIDLLGRREGIIFLFWMWTHSSLIIIRYEFPGWSWASTLIGDTCYTRRSLIKGVMPRPYATGFPT